MSESPTATTAVGQDEQIEGLRRFLKTYYKDEVMELAQRYPNEQQSLEISWRDFHQHDAGFAERLLQNPDEVIEQLNAALHRYDLPVDISLDEARVRITDLGDEHISEVDQVRRAANLGRYVGVTGQVKKASKIVPELREAAFECQRCGTMTYVPQVGNNLQNPHECQGCERQGPFKVNRSQSHLGNIQKLQLQEPPEDTEGGIAEKVNVIARDDLVGEVQPGDRTTVTAVLEMEDPEDSPRISTYLDSKGVEVEETDFEDIDTKEYEDEIREIADGAHGDPYELLVDSIAPKIHGNEQEKLAIALQLFGAPSMERPSGDRDRGEFHVLLLGDPGCGKSTLLEAVDNIAPRSTYASGKGASAAGMTAAAVPDNFGDSEWTLEAGAMVIANGGVACVDEIDKINEDAVSSLHGALESQRVHVNKAGINTHLNARTALLAAGNPADGRFNTHQAIGEQIDMPPALMSRFDLMFMMTDEPDPDEDRDVVEHMLKSRRAAGHYTRDGELTAEESERIEPALERDLLRAYVAYAKQNAHPIIQDEALIEQIRDYFVTFRMTADGQEDSPVPVTYRQVEAVARLAEASARIRLADEVAMQDVRRAIDLVETSMKQVGYDPETGEFDADIVETGQSTSTKKHTHQVKDTVREMEGDESVNEERLREQLIEDGMSPRAAAKAIETARKKGRIYNQGDGWRAT